MASRTAISSTARSLLRAARPQPSRCATCQVFRAYATAAPAAAKSPEQTPSTSGPSTTTSNNVSPKVSQIVDQIAGLSLLEASELVSELKTRLNIADVAVAAPVAVPAAASGGATASAGPAAAEPEKPKEKTTFTVSLTKIDAAQKAKVIKEVKNVNPNMNLVEAKKFVENLPQKLKENIPKDDADKLKKALEAVGASVEIS